MFFGQDIKFYLYFMPSVESNGDVLLTATSVSVGKLELPKSELLKFVKNNYDLPDWVEVDIEKDSLVLYLSQIKALGGVGIAAKEIDLANDKIVFTASLK